VRTAPLDRSGPRSEAGLTLIELIVVITIVALAMSTVALRLDGVTSNSRLKSSARRIGTTIEFLQNQGIVNGRFYFLEVDLDEERLRTVVAPEWAREGMDVEGETKPLPWRVLERGVQIEDLTFDDGVMKDQDRILIPFGPTGMTWGFVLHLINEKGRRVSIEANSVTGLVQFYPYYKEVEEIPEELF